MKSKKQERAKTLRIVIYDDSDSPLFFQFLLRGSWRIGAFFYRIIGRFDLYLPAYSWQESLKHIVDYSKEKNKKISEIQFWGHGQWGTALIAADVLSVNSFEKEHPHSQILKELKERFDSEQSLFWLRTCKSFATLKGHQFAENLSQKLGCSVAGHTYIIGPLQSGLHVLEYNKNIDWSENEGVKEVSVDDKTVKKAKNSSLSAPNTIFCLQSNISTHAN